MLDLPVSSRQSCSPSLAKSHILAGHDLPALTQVKLAAAVAADPAAVCVGSVIGAVARDLDAALAASQSPSTMTSISVSPSTSTGISVSPSTSTVISVSFPMTTSLLDMEIPTSWLLVLICFICFVWLLRRQRRLTEQNVALGQELAQHKLGFRKVGAAIKKRKREINGFRLAQNLNMAVYMNALAAVQGQAGSSSSSSSSSGGVQDTAQGETNVAYTEKLMTLYLLDAMAKRLAFAASFSAFVIYYITAVVIIILTLFLGNRLPSSSQRQRQHLLNEQQRLRQQQREQQGQGTWWMVS